jgi:hypothetical protein
VASSAAAGAAASRAPRPHADWEAWAVEGAEASSAAAARAAASSADVVAAAGVFSAVEAAASSADRMSFLSLVMCTRRFPMRRLPCFAADLTRTALTAGLLGLLLLAAAPLGTAEGGESDPRSFDTPEQAVEALVQAMAANDDAALKALFGPGNEDLVDSGTDPIVRRDREGFVADARQRLDLELVEDGVIAIVVGRSAWPLPVPVVRKGGRWMFDAAIGRTEILARRIGNNELEAIEVCRAFVESQLVYGQRDWDGDGVLEYAQRIASTPGKRDGLYWPSADDKTDISPLGPSVAPLERYLKDAPDDAPLSGYYWKVLKQQGPNAPGGAHTFVLNGNMIAGFALVGTPAKYLDTGVMTFLVSYHGKIFQKDLGKDSLKLAAALEAYDPDDAWVEVDPNAPIEPTAAESAAAE